MASIHALSGSLQFHEGRGLASFFFFQQDPKARLTKLDAKKLAAAIEYKEDPETALRCYALGFYRQAKLQGLDIPALINEICAYTREKKRSTAPIEGPEGLATILSKLAINESPEQLGKRLQELMDACLPEAIEHLQECEKANGRDQEDGTGYIYLRKQSEKGKVA